MSPVAVSVDTPPELPALDPVELADLLVLELVARERGTLSLEPRGEHHAVVWHTGAAHAVVARVPASTAEAAIARLAVVCEMPIASGQSARLRVLRKGLLDALGGAASELLVSVRASASGLCADLYALAHDAPQGGIDVVGLTPVAHAGEARYRIIEELGHGGMGIVYRAQHQALEKEVALKVLTPALARSADMAAQFVVEARAACRARHPNIVDVTDFGQLSDGRSFLVMELVSWPTLEARLRGGPLPAKDALTIALGIASGLRAAHAQGVVHLDLKPANVFVSPENEVKLGDFGLAVTSGSHDGPLGDATMGTPRYMAPEQARTRSADARSDLYSLGCILFEMLAGAPPFAVTGLVEVALRDEHQPLPPLPAGVPAGVQALAHQLLATRPAQRPASADEVVAALERLHGARLGWQRWVPR